MKELVIIVGARPQFIKLAPLLKACPDEIKISIIHTGQHYDFEMSKIFFNQLNLPEVDFHLGIGSAGQASQTGKMMIELEAVFESEKPDAVIVIGDTNSTLAGAMTAAKLRIPLIHIEAGLRSIDKNIPEQVNRILTDRVSDVLCCPDLISRENLQSEGITDGVEVTGDILYDLIRLIEPGEKLAEQLLTKLGLESENYVMMTMHRAGNVDNSLFLNSIIDGLESFSEKIFIPMHPRTLKQLEHFQLLDRMKRSKNIVISKPVGIIESLALVRHAKAVITDSGGLQREAAFYNRKTFVMRTKTEWRELELNKAVTCIGSDLTKVDINSNYSSTITPDYFKPASGNIAKTLIEFFS